MHLNKLKSNVPRFEKISKDRDDIFNLIFPPKVVQGRQKMQALADSQLLANILKASKA